MPIKDSVSVYYLDELFDYLIHCSLFRFDSGTYSLIHQAIVNFFSDSSDVILLLKERN